MASLFIELAAAGLVGVECYYSEHSAELTKEYLAMAKQANLVPTGGSDFHGKVSTGIRLGVGFGGLNVPDEALAQLEERCRAERQPWRKGRTPSRLSAPARIMRRRSTPRAMPPEGGIWARAARKVSSRG